jgi:hypothetical protein
MEKLHQEALSDAVFPAQGVPVAELAVDTAVVEPTAELVLFEDKTELWAAAAAVVEVIEEEIAGAARTSERERPKARGRERRMIDLQTQPSSFQKTETQMVTRS